MKHTNFWVTRHAVWMGLSAVIMLTGCLIFGLAPRVLAAEGPPGTMLPVYYEVRMNGNWSAAWGPEENQKVVDVLKRHIALMENMGLKADYGFTSLQFEYLDANHPEVMELLKKSGRTFCLHGANRPPRPQPIERIHGEKWEDDVKAIMDYETHYVHPETGEIQSDREGGLKKWKARFGDQLILGGRFFQSSILHVYKQLGLRMGTGFVENTRGPRADVWFMGMLMIPERWSVDPASIRPWAERGGEHPGEAVEKMMAGWNRSKVNFITIVMHDTDFVRSPAPEELWKKYEELLRWFADRPTFKNMSYGDYSKMVVDDRERQITRPMTDAFVKAVLASEKQIPCYVQVGDDWLSAADGFQGVVGSLCAYEKDGKLPESVMTCDILGPTQYVDSNLPAEPIAAKELLGVASRMARELQTSDRIPAGIDLPGGKRVNATEFLYACAKCYDEISGTDVTKAAPIAWRSMELPPKVSPALYKVTVAVRGIEAPGMEPATKGKAPEAAKAPADTKAPVAKAESEGKALGVKGSGRREGGGLTFAADRLTLLQCWTLKPARYRIDGRIVTASDDEVKDVS